MGSACWGGGAGGGGGTIHARSSGTGTGGEGRGTARTGGATGRCVGGLGAGRGGEPMRGSGAERIGGGGVGGGGAALASGTSTPSSSASRLTNQRASEPRSTSGSSGRAAQSFTVASMPAARRDASMNPYEPAEPWTLWVSCRRASSASRSPPATTSRSASPASTPSWARALSRYSASSPGGSSGGGDVASPAMDYQDGEPPRQNARAGGSRVVARAGPGAILPQGHRAEGQAMKRSLQQLTADGVVGGVLAGLVVALWFLAVDSIAGRPFHTPAALASALTRQAVGPPTFRLVAAYSVVHFAVFAVLGVAMAGAIGALRTPPRLLFGVLFGLVAQELAFYAGLLLSDASRVAVVPWPHVVAANVLSGFLLMGYLHRAARDQNPFGWSAFKGHPLLAQGLVTGLIGAGVVALWFFALDLAAGHPLRTPAALGAALLFGASNVAAIDMNFG